MKVWEDRGKEELRYHRGPLTVPVKVETALEIGDVSGIKGEETMVKREKQLEVKEEDGHEGQASMDEEAGDATPEDDEAWEEKIRREIEGDED